MRRFFANIFILIFYATMSYGQSVPFLNYFSDARAAAMGNTGYALSSSFSVQRNTAAIMSDFAPVTDVGASYLLWQPQVANSNLIQVAGYTKLKNLGVSAGVRYHTQSEIRYADEHGNPTGSFTPKEYALEIGLAYKINANISAGATLRNISSDMNGSKKGSSTAADISMLYSRENLNFGLGITNLGSKVSYGYYKYDLPARVQAGVAYRLLNNDKNSVTGAVDAAYQLASSNSGVVAGLGVEYTYNNLISLRTGYHTDGKAIGVSYATVGFGVHVSGLSVDLAYALASSDNPMRQTLIVSLSWGIMDKK